MAALRLPKSAVNTLVVVVIAAVVAAVVYFGFLAGSSSKTVKAQFAAAVGIYVGTPVEILGVPVGKVTGVHPHPGYVEVDMTYDSKYSLPKDAGAVEVANSLVSDRYVQLAPVYKGSGPVMASGATIPVEHTDGPAELDQIYAALNKLSVALGPAGANKGGKNGGALNTLLTVAAANLKGNGAAIGNSITKLSQAAETLANNRGNLFGTVRNLQTFTTAIKGSDAAIKTFNQQLAQVAGDLASERGDLGAALHELGIALDAVGTFVKANAGKFHTDIKGLESITGTLVKEKASINETLAVAPVALANITHAYDPVPGVIGTRSNLASLANLNLTDINLGKVCSTLTNTLTNLGATGTNPLKSFGGTLATVCGSLNGVSTGNALGGLGSVLGGLTGSTGAGPLTGTLGGLTGGS